MSFLYLDSSAIVKLFLPESHTALVENEVEKADGLICSAIGFLEVMGVFSRAHNQGRISRESLGGLVAQFKIWWGGVTHLRITDLVLVKAGNYAIDFGIRGIDALHFHGVESSQKTGPVSFICFDDRLAKVAYDQGFNVITDPELLELWEKSGK